VLIPAASVHLSTARSGGDRNGADMFAFADQVGNDAMFALSLLSFSVAVVRWTIHSYC
jgi:hypothetical protein